MEEKLCGRGRAKNLFFLCFILFLLVLEPKRVISGENERKTVQNQAKVTFLQGKAEVLPKGEAAWKLLKLDSFLSNEDEVRTGEKARLEILLPDRSILRFDQLTAFKMKNVLFDAQELSRDVRVELAVGKTWVNVRKIFSPKKTFEVAAANAVAGVRDTIWRMNIENDRSTLIRVYEGMVEVYSPFVKPEYKPEGKGFEVPREVKGPQEVPRPFEEVSREVWEQIVLTQMMQVVIPPMGKPEKPASFNLEEDQKEEWVRWNQKRNKEKKGP